MKIIDLSFYADKTMRGLPALVNLHRPAMGYAAHLKEMASIQFIKHQHNGEQVIEDGIKCTAFKSRNGFFYTPFKTIRYIRQEKPDVVIVHGFIFVMQVAWLRKQLGKQAVILLQYHGEKPFTGIKGWLQRKMDRYIDGYLFTSIDIAKPWLLSGVINNEHKCLELQGASTNFKAGNGVTARQLYGREGNENFLWVGRLNEGKDPLTVVKAFESYCKANPSARLYLVFQSGELLGEIKKIIDSDPVLQERIILVGKLKPEVLEAWYQAADFYISSSHYESTGYTLLEAMACGCIPIITDIPSFNKITQNGRYGLMYDAGNEVALRAAFSQLDKLDKAKMREDILNHFEKELSFRSIAGNLFGICKKLLEEKRTG